MTARATGFWRKRPWLLKLFSTISALKTFFRESHYSFMQIQYKRFIASLGNILIVIVISFHDVYIVLLAFAIRCWGRKLEKCRCLNCSFLLFKCVETLFLHWNDHVCRDSLDNNWTNIFYFLKRPNFILSSNFTPRVPWG